MSLLGNLLGVPSKRNFKDPAEAANPYLQQIPQTAQQYYNPYIEQGQQASNVLQSQYDQLLNPASKLHELERGYEESPGAAYKRDKMQKAVDASAAAGGISGNPYHQQQTGELVNSILSQDMQDYLRNALGLYGQGLQGEEGIAQKGFGSSASLADILTGNLGSQGTLAYQGAQQQNMLNQGRQNSLSKLIANALGAGGGFLMGGPKGALRGAALSNSLMGGSSATPSGYLTRGLE